jgi:hypothetical protein
MRSKKIGNFCRQHAQKSDVDNWVTPKKNPGREGVKCPKCGKFKPFSGYVYAHWDEKLFYGCDCGHSITFHKGEIIDSTPKKNKHAQILGRKGGKASTPAKRAAALKREAVKRETRKGGK